MCNLYSLTKAQQAIRDLAGAMRDVSGNLPLFPGIFPDYAAPIVRNAPDGVRELSTARWGMPSPVFALKGRNSDSGVTNVRNVSSPHWRRWWGVESRCVVPLTSFSEFNKAEGRDIWFAFDESRPLAFFAGIWTRWESVRKVGRGGERPVRLPDNGAERCRRTNSSKAMRVILTTRQEVEQWLTAPPNDALALQRPLPDNALRIVARGKKEDGVDAA
jgi:putative SOS response-associated peptidase YedK